MSWRKLNYLVPEPQCRTEEGVVTEWTDSRRQPTQAQIDAVNMSLVEAREKTESFDAEIDSSPVLKALFDELESNSPGFKNRAKGRN